MARGAETRDVERSFGRQRLADAHAFLRQARHTAEHIADQSDRAAAVSSAVLAAIAGADAACALRLGVVWKGDHSQAHTLLRRVAGAADAANALQRVVALKTQAQYLSDTITETKMRTALRHAETVSAYADAVSMER